MADRPSLPPAEQGLTADNTLMTEVTGFYRKFVALSEPFSFRTRRDIRKNTHRQNRSDTRQIHSNALV